jgi:hypothetical protein
VNEPPVDFNSNGVINADYGIDQSLDVSFVEDLPLDVSFGSVYAVGGDCKVLYASTATWNSKPKTLSKEGYIYIYSDYRDGKPAIKIGDGKAYLIDLPFTDDEIVEHINNTVIHITQEERNFWNDKVRCYIDPNNENRLIFTTE